MDQTPIDFIILSIMDLFDLYPIGTDGAESVFESAIFASLF